MDAQQKQLHETQEHLRTQAEFQQAIQRKLEEQTEKQMKVNTWPAKLSLRCKVCKH